MPEIVCDACRELFKNNEDNNEFSALLERTFPNCACEQFSVGEGSPGRVEDSEKLHRLIISPRDYDPETKTIRERPFYKLFENGLSVYREIATDADVQRLCIEGLCHPASEEPKQVFAVCEIETEVARRITNASGDRIFCIYDQTVSPAETDQAPVPTHAGIFQRLPLPGTADGKRIRKDFAGQLRKRFMAGVLDLASLRNGLFSQLNARAKNREFVSN